MKPDRGIPLISGLSLGQGIIDLLRSCDCVVRAELTGAVRRMDPVAHEVALVASVKAEDKLASVVHFLRDRGFAMRPVPDHLKIPQALKASMTRLIRAVPAPTSGRDHTVAVYLTFDFLFPAVWVYTTGDALHNEALYRLKMHHASTGNEAFHAVDEAQVYSAAGLPYILPEMREGYSMAQDPRKLMTAQLIRGDLHTHSVSSDGALTITETVLACLDLGYEYCAITDHSQSLHIAGGLSPDRLLSQRDEIAEVRKRFPEFMVLHGAEVDILDDGQLDYSKDILDGLDIVLASIHSNMRQHESQLTQRLLSAIHCPYVHIIGHPTGRWLGKRPSYPVDMLQIIEAAAREDVALELNASPHRLDLDPKWLRIAAEAGCLFAINSDAHKKDDLNRIADFGVTMAHKGWLMPDQVINTWPTLRLKSWLAAKKHRP